MSRKIVYILTVLAFATVVSVTNGTPAATPLEFHATKANLSNHLIFGIRESGDRLFLRENVTKPWAWLQIVTLTKDFTIGGYNKITQVRALDQETDGYGAMPSFTAGGPGTNKVTLHFTSKRGYGINFVVEVYAKAW